MHWCMGFVVNRRLHQYDPGIEDPEIQTDSDEDFAFTHADFFIIIYLMQYF